MRIVVVTARLPHGRGETFLVPELRHLAELGHDVLLVPLRCSGGPEQALPAGIQVASCQLLAVRVLLGALQASLRAPGRLLDVLLALPRDHRLWILLTNLASLPKALWLAELARRWRADHIHAYWASAPATVAGLASLMSSVPWSFSGHRYDIVQGNLIGWKLASASGMRVVSISGMRLLIECLGRAGIRDAEATALLARTQVIHLGVDLPALAAPAATDPVVVCPAMLAPVKGHQVLLQAFRLVVEVCPSARLLLAGTGALERRLRDQAVTLGIGPSVEFLGHVSHAELLEMYSRGRIACVALASVILGPGHHEGIPVALMEAMSYGIPVVSTATGGIPELLTTDSGILVPPDDPIGFAEAIRRILTDKALHVALGRGGRGRIKGEFEARSCAGAVIRMLRGTPAGRAA